MSKQLSFTSTFFKPIAGEEDQTNPGRFGKALAQWIAEELRKAGTAIEGVIPEDFGWVVMVYRKPFPLWIACGNEDGSEERWVMYVVAEPSLFQRVLRRVNPAPAVAELEERLARIVQGAPGASDVSWEAA